MLHLGPRTFEELSGEVVQSTAFVLRKEEPMENTATYYRLVDYRSNEEKKQAFLEGKNCFPGIPQTNFSKIPGSPVAYWGSLRMLKTFEENRGLDSYVSTKVGLDTGDNETYLKIWYELEIDKIGFGCSNIDEFWSKSFTWVPHTKGGGFRKWYGNLEFVLKFDKKTYEVLSNIGNKLPSRDYYFKPGLNWSRISSGNLSVRMTPPGYVFNSACPTIFGNQDLLDYILALLNCAISNPVILLINPTLNFQAGTINKIPLRLSKEEAVLQIVNKCTSISIFDWNSRETSWEFEANPLIRQNKAGLAASFEAWHRAASEAFFQLHQNEEELNRIFIKIYGLQEELTPEVALKDITILQEELDYKALEEWQPPFAPGSLVPLKKDVPVKQLISYAIGCFMGRYRLDKPGLHIAHPQPSAEELAPYDFQGKQNLEGFQQPSRFEIDEDAILPLMGSRCAFPDDALQRLRGFLEMIWGAEELTASLNFINQSLDKDLEDWLCKDFWPYHTRMYQKKPIYWLFASPKGAFQVLVYMHRMNAYTVEKIRDKYLLRHMQYQQQQIAGMKERESSLDKAGQKKLEQLQKDLMECEAYDLKLKDMATRQINFDLDDGVTKNYALFEGVVAAIK
jgi:hypothetical protein